MRLFVRGKLENFEKRQNHFHVAINTNSSVKNDGHEMTKKCEMFFSAFDFVSACFWQVLDVLAATLCPWPANIKPILLVLPCVNLDSNLNLNSSPRHGEYVRVHFINTHPLVQRNSKFKENPPNC